MRGAEVRSRASLGSATCPSAARRGWCPRSGADNEAPGGTGCPPTGTPGNRDCSRSSIRRRIRCRRALRSSVRSPGTVPEIAPPGQFDSECRPLRARFRMDVRGASHNGLVHQTSGLCGRNVEKPDSIVGGLDVAPVSCFCSGVIDHVGRRAVDASGALGLCGRSWSRSGRLSRVKFRGHSQAQIGWVRAGGRYPH
jgi:hypothetical protein